MEKLNPKSLVCFMHCIYLARHEQK